MDRLEVEIYSQATNAAIVKVPGRQYPGLVLQGDSLSILCDHAARLHKNLLAEAWPEAEEEASELRNLLSAYQRHYESVLEDHGISLPYVKSDRE